MHENAPAFMNATKKNLAANTISNGWMLLVSIVSVPFCLHFLGAEGFGLVVFLAAVQAVFSPLDLGLSMTLNRELARLSGQEGSAAQMRNLLRTLELPYWLVAGAITLMVVATGPMFVQLWVTPKALSAQDISQATVLMGLALGLQWASVLYQAGLTGLQKQVSQGLLNIVLWAMRYLGVIPVLWHWPTVQAYFIWNAIVSGLHTAALGLWLWKVLPPASHRAEFQWPLLKSIRYFAAGNTGIQLSSTALSQLDKIVVGRLLSLEWMGYYGLASQACVGLLRLVYSLQPTFFPRYTQLIADNRWEDLTSLYHRSCQLMAVVTFSIMAVVVLFSHEIILLWTGQAAVADHAWLIMSLLIVGTALSSLTMLPSSLQLAYGWTKLSAAANFISLVVLVPAMIVLARRYGAVGAAAAWIIPYAVQVFVFIPLMHRRLLPGELWKWYLRDNAVPLLAAAAAATALRLLVPSQGSPVVLLVGVLAAGGAALLASSLAAPVTRAWLAGIVKR